MEHIEETTIIPELGGTRRASEGRKHLSQVVKGELEFLKFRRKDILRFFFFFFLTVPRGLWDPSLPTRAQTRALGSESAESQPLDDQGIPFFKKMFFTFFVFQKGHYGGGHGMGKGTEPGKCLACLGKVFLRQKIFQRNELEMRLEKMFDGWILKNI